MHDYCYAFASDSDFEVVLRYEDHDALLRDFDRINYEFFGRHDWGVQEIDEETALMLISEATDKSVYCTDYADMWVI